MKTAIISAFVLIFGTNAALATHNPKVTKIIGDAVQFEQGKLPLAENQSEFVKMSFTIGDNNKVQIIDVNSSNDEIKSHVLSKVSELELEQNNAEHDTLYYNIVFKKL